MFRKRITIKQKFLSWASLFKYSSNKLLPIFIIFRFIFKEIIYYNFLCFIFYLEFKENYSSIKTELKYEVKLVNDIDLIYKCFLGAGRRLSKDDIRKWILLKYHCWMAFDEDVPVGAVWVWFGNCHLPSYSGKCFSMNNVTLFVDSIGYECFAQVQNKYRGKGIYTSLLTNMINYYSKTKISGFVTTMGATNISPIKVYLKYKIRLIGIIRIIKIFGSLKRKILFLDERYKYWE